MSSYLLEIPHDGYMLLSQILIGCSTLSQEYSKLICLYWKIMRDNVTRYHALSYSKHLHSHRKYIHRPTTVSVKNFFNIFFRSNSVKTSV